MADWRKYGVATHVYFPLVKRGVVDLAVSADWTPATADVKISKDGGAAANVTNLPTAIAMGNTAYWDISLTATEMQAAKVVITVADAATKAVEDQFLDIMTYATSGELSGVDFTDAVRMGLTALPNAAAEAAGGLYTRGTGAGQIRQDSNGRIDANAKAWIDGTIPAVNVTGVPLVDDKYLLGTIYSTPATAGIQDVNAKNLGNTALTGRDIGASVLLSAGTGTGQIDFTSGVVKANLAQILGTALTETAGLLAGAFKKFFNVATPTGTVNSIPDAVAGASGGLFIAGSNAATTANITGNLTGNVTGSVGSVTGAVGSLTTNNDKTGYALTTLESAVLQSGTAQAGTASTITLAAGASATDSLYVGCIVKVYGGTGAAQVRVITGYVGATKVATVDHAWATNPDNTSTYAVIAIEGAALNSSLQPIAASVAGAVGSVTGAVGSVTGAVGSVTGNVGGNVTGTIGGYASGQAPLQPTVAGRTLDVATTGEAGLDFDNIHDASGAHTLTNVRVPNVTLTDTVTTYTGNTVQTGDAYAVANGRLPTALTANGNIKASLLEILTTALTETAGLLAGGFKKFFNVASPTLTALGVDQTGDSFAVVNSGTFGNAQLVRSTTPANTLDVSATGEAGLDFNNIKDATGAHTLTNIRVPAVTLTDTLTTYTGNTVQTGDSFARLGAPAGASVSADIAEIEAETDGIGTDTSGVTTLLTRVPGVVQPQTGDSYARIGAPVGASISADIAEVEGETDAIIATLGTPAGASVSADIAEIEAETDAIGAAGAGLTALGDTRIANLDATVSSRLATSGYTTPPTAAQNRAEMDSNSTQLASLITSMAQVYGLAGQNYGLRNTAYDGSGNLLTYDLCIYDTTGHATTNNGATGLTAKYGITNTYNGSNQLTGSVSIKTA